MRTSRSSNPVVQNALSVWDNLLDIYLDRAATEGKMGDAKEAAMWFDKANTLRMIMKRTDQTSGAARNGAYDNYKSLADYKLWMKAELSSIQRFLAEILSEMKSETDASTRTVREDEAALIRKCYENCRGKVSALLETAKGLNENVMI